MFVHALSLLGLPSPVARTSLTPQSCEKSCIENVFMWPGPEAREKFCKDSHCQGCRFCDKMQTETELQAAMDAECLAHGLCGKPEQQEKSSNTVSGSSLQNYETKKNMDNWYKDRKATSKDCKYICN